MNIRNYKVSKEFINGQTTLVLYANKNGITICLDYLEGLIFKNKDVLITCLVIKNTRTNVVTQYEVKSILDFAKLRFHLDGCYVSYQQEDISKIIDSLDYYGIDNGFFCKMFKVVNRRLVFLWNRRVSGYKIKS